MNKERYTIGRLPDNDIRIDNPAVRSHHSLIINILNDSFLKDLNSTNGTYVKLMYFLQEAGEGLRLKYEKAVYGPYATNLRHVLTAIEGHFVVGYGDAEDNPDKPLELRKGAGEAAERFLADLPDTLRRFDQVADLIEGFETPLGMELLATVHWVAAREGAQTLPEAIEKTYSWNERKRAFSEKHIGIAWKVLQQKGWLHSAKA